jgi:hypothetical protein
MATKKKSAKAAISRGNSYILTATGKKHLADVSGQGAQIRDTLKASRVPLTAAQLSERLPKMPKPNIAFYLSTWKADGFVKFSGKK